MYCHIGVLREHYRSYLKKNGVSFVIFLQNSMVSKKAGHR